MYSTRKPSMTAVALLKLNGAELHPHQCFYYNGRSLLNEFGVKYGKDDKWISVDVLKTEPNLPGTFTETKRIPKDQFIDEVFLNVYNLGDENNVWDWEYECL